LPDGLVTAGAWANYGPDAKPVAGERGYDDGGEYYGFDPHSSPDGLDFYEPSRMDPSAIKFPPEFFGRAFVARFGDLENFGNADNPNPATSGYDVVSLRLDDAHQGFVCNTFLDDTGRAIDVLCAYNGKVYVLEFNPQTIFPGAGWGSPSKLYEIGCTIPLTPLISVSTDAIDREVDYTLPVGDTDTFAVSNLGAGILNYDITFAPDGPEAVWLDVAPLAGDSTGPADDDLITVSYLDDVITTLDIGTYTATITVSDPQAFNDPAMVVVTLVVKTVLPDFDADGDVDQEDFGRQQACLSGTATLEPGCGVADFNGDGFVNSTDMKVFLGCMSGADVVADPTCDDAYE
jgi:hypothetical protein